MYQSNLLQHAIAKARAGQELSARELFLEIIRAEPHNELAWMWLVGLLDDLNERIYACERILQLNPANNRIKTHLQTMLAQREKAREDELRRFREQVEQIRQMAKASPKEALASIRELVEGELETATGWELLSKLSDDIHERAWALENFMRLAPTEPDRPRSELETLKYFRDNPLDLAAEYEDQGKFYEAILVYSRMMLAFRPTDRAWGDLYNRIYRIERIIHEKLPFISPTLSILRLTTGPSMLYLILLLIHVGFRPLANLEPVLWLGYLWVLLGGFMVALAAVHSPERLQSFMHRAFGIRHFPAALAARFIGYVLIVAPYILLFCVAYQRIKLYAYAIFSW